MAVIRATFWDHGGVISSSPFEAFAAFEQANGLPSGIIRRINATNPHANAWAGLERGEATIDEFCVRFQAEAHALGAQLDPRAVLACLSGRIRPEMVEAVRRCRERLLTGMITNNFTIPGRTASPSGVHELFDVVVESRTAGVRKPDPAIYLLACERLGVEPAESVFLDDLGINLKPARELGMTTIKVTDPAAALRELEEVVGFDLGGGGPAAS